MSDNISYKDDQFYLEPLSEEQRKKLREGDWVILYLTKEEIKTLYEYFKNQYINYENLPLLELVRKISAIANDDL